MKKLMPLMLMSLLFQTGIANAHQVWIEQDGSKATLQFGEFGDNLRETSPGLLDKFVAPTAKLIGKKGEQSLTMNKTPNGFVLSGTAAQGESLVAEEASYPVIESKHDGKSSRLIWTPAARYITDFAEQQPKLTFDIVPTGKPGQFKVVYKGQPVSKVKIAAVIPSGWSKEATTDEQGMVSFEMPWRGEYVLEGHYNDKTAGQRDGKSYDTASFVTSLSFTLPDGIAAVPASAAVAGMSK